MGELLRCIHAFFNRPAKAIDQCGKGVSEDEAILHFDQLLGLIKLV